MRKKLKILFLCTGNACRSQMAEGWTRHLKSDIIEAWSAGVETHNLDPYAVRAMAEVGVDISKQHSKHVTDVMDVPFDIVITVCDHAREHCPVFPRKVTHIHKNFDDPPFLARNARNEEEVFQIYRRVRDEIRSFIAGMPGNLDTVDNQ